MRFSVLASGSRGNASLVRTDGPALLIDLGVSPRLLEERRRQLGACGCPISAALLTHTHADHIDDASLRWLSRQAITFYCHEQHRTKLAGLAGFQALDALGLVRHYDQRPWLAPNGMQVEAIPLSHDDHPTFGFRIESKPGHRSRSVKSLGYVADTGTWNDQTVEALRSVDVLGVEFNHDVVLQRNSSRPQFLIGRVLGSRGHLSNDQGGALIEAVLERSGKRGLKAVVLLHLSQDCNRPDLARAAAKAALQRAGHRARVLVATQNTPLEYGVSRPPAARSRVQDAGFKSRRVAQQHAVAGRVAHGRLFPE